MCDSFCTFNFYSFLIIALLHLSFKAKYECKHGGAESNRFKDVEALKQVSLFLQKKVPFRSCHISKSMWEESDAITLEAKTTKIL